MKNSPIRAASVLLLALGLAACGGGGDTTTAPTTPITPTSAAGSLTLSASAPAARDGTLDLATATTSGNNARAADGFSSQPYCEIFWENVTSSTGATYAVQVYFRQSDQKVLHTSVMDSDIRAIDLWSVFDSDGTAGISGVAVDLASKTLTYSSKVLTGDPTTETTTVNGAVTFPANATVAACGS